jgi:putative DNA primase/helicase
MGSKVSPVCPALRAELSSLLGRRRAAFDTLGHVQSSTQRVDALCAEVRGCVADSGLRYVDGELSHYEDGGYVPIRKDALMMTLANVLYSLGVGASDVRKMADMPLSVLWDMAVESDPMLVRFDDCVLNLRTGRRSPHSPSLPVTWRMGYALGDGRPDAPEWMSFLSEVVPDEAERACLQEFFGLCLIDRRAVSVEKMAIFVGGGANGKSVVFDVVKAVMGLDKVGFLSPDQLADPKQAVTLRGKVVNFAPDVRKGASFDSALKALASSQEVQGWKLYEGNVVVKCPPLVFALNEMPAFRDVTDAFFRRLLVFRFGVTIPPDRQDRGLAARIAASELPGVFGWIHEGARRLSANGGAFTPCELMEKDLEVIKRKARAAASPVSRWLERNGLYPEPRHSGQHPLRVAQSHIFHELRGSVTKTDITREMASLGVCRLRGAEVVYILYKNDSDEGK